ncbi:hypothetical protein KCU67_g67, partial [Aureobasidium melanogenum]
MCIKQVIVVHRGLRLGKKLPFIAGVAYCGVPPRSGWPDMGDTCKHVFFTDQFSKWISSQLRTANLGSYIGRGLLYDASKPLKVYDDIYRPTPGFGSDSFDSHPMRQLEFLINTNSTLWIDNFDDIRPVNDRLRVKWHKTSPFKSRYECCRRRLIRKAGRGIVITLRFRHSSSNCFDKCIEWLSNSRIRYCVPEGFVCGKNISVNHQYAISSLIQAVGSAAYLYGGGSCGAQSILTLIPSKMTSGCIQSIAHARDNRDNRDTQHSVASARSPWVRGRSWPSTRPPLEKTLSHSADIAGAARRSNAISDSSGYCASCIKVTL